MKKTFCLILLCLAAAFFLMSCEDDSLLILDGQTEASYVHTESGERNDERDVLNEEVTAPLIMVHICGMVNKPGVYEVSEGSRVYEVVEQAGGFAPEAAEDYLNLAEAVVEEAQDDCYGQETEGENNGQVNINTADKELLMSLPGIGEAKALAIIAWRTEHGSFQSTEEIMLVSGIKEAAYEKIKLLITTE